MRLAAEYNQQKKVPTNPKEEHHRKYIVRLGKGRPEEKRKRGISLSNGKAQLEERSLGRGQTCQEKRKEMQESRNRQQLTQTPRNNQRPIVSAATYGTGMRKIPSNYAQQHLRDGKQFAVHPQILVKTVRSQGILSKGQLNRYVANSEQQFERSPMIREQGGSRPPSTHIISISHSSPRMVDKNIGMPIQQNHVNISPFVPQIPHRESQPVKTEICRLKSCEPIPVDHLSDSLESEGTKSRGRIIFPTNTHLPKGQPKQRVTDRLNKDPYSLTSSKMTRKMQASKDSQYLQSGLKQTRKQQFSSNGSLSLQSRGKGLLSGGQISLWDANKVESIVPSMNQSRAQLRLEESDVVVDYFNRDGQ